MTTFEKCPLCGEPVLAGAMDAHMADPDSCPGSRPSPDKPPAPPVSPIDTHKGVCSACGSRAIEDVADIAGAVGALGGCSLSLAFLGLAVACGLAGFAAPVLWGAGAVFFALFLLLPTPKSEPRRRCRACGHQWRV